MANYAVEQANTGFGNRFPSGCQPGALRFLHWAVATFHLAVAGCFSPVSKLTSGRWSWHKYGKAVDLGANWWSERDRRDGQAFWDWALAHADELGLQQMIWGNMIWDVSFGWRIYHGRDHYNHIHLAMSYPASQNWRPPTTTPAPPADTRKRASMFILRDQDTPGVIVDYVSDWMTGKRKIADQVELGAIQACFKKQGMPFEPIVVPRRELVKLRDL